MFKKHLSEPKVLGLLGVIVLIPLALIAKEDLSTAVVFWLYVVRCFLSHIGISLSCFVFAIMLLVMSSGFVLLSSYRMGRIKHT